MEKNPMKSTRKLKEQLIESLNLHYLNPDEWDDDEPLFGEGIGLDSVDAIELIILLERHYGIQVKDPKQGPEIFYSIKSMANYIEMNREISNSA